jgi:hypothetical protein
MNVDMGDLILGATVSLTVAETSVGIAAADLNPTVGIAKGMSAEIAVIKNLGPMYIEGGGGDATSSSFPLETTNDVIVVKGYTNISKLRFIKNTNNTGVKILIGYC